MLLSLSLIFILGILFNHVLKRIKIPSIIGYVVIGIVLGPSVLNILDDSLLNISTEIRQIILIVILTRAGLTLNIKDLKKIGIPALLLSFIPASFEIIGVMILAPKLVGLSLIDSALLGAVLGAVSPAIVAPRMITLINSKIGSKKGIPQLILAGSSIDDIYALVLFTTFLSLAMGDILKASKIIEVPITIILGIMIGVIIGVLISFFFRKYKFDSIYQVIILLSISFILVTIENILPISGILSVMSMALILNKNLPKQAKEIEYIYNQIWIIGEILLFTLVGSSVNVSYTFTQGFSPILLIIGALFIRMIGVYLSVIPTNLTFKEKVFVLISYTPKATVQAAIGGIPLAMGLDSGELILTVSVLAILITAPLGAIGIDNSYHKLLKNN